MIGKCSNPYKGISLGALGTQEVWEGSLEEVTFLKQKGEWRLRRQRQRGE